MSMTDPLADLLTRIRNGQAANKTEIKLPSSKLKRSVCEVLRQEGYIEGYSVSEDVAKPTLTVSLKYFKGQPVIANITRVSKPGRRVYRSTKDLPVVIGGLGVAIISTSKGVLSDRAARDAGEGGEVLCTVC